VFFGELEEIKAVVREKAQSKSPKTKNRRGGACLLPLSTKKGRKMKFRPEITRVKLNPEQAVLTCTCYANRRIWTEYPVWVNVPSVGGNFVNACKMEGIRQGKLYEFPGEGEPASGYWEGGRTAESSASS